MKVLAAAKDAGGANAIAPVLKRLIAMPGMEVCAMAYAQSQPIFDGYRLPLKPLEAYAKAGGVGSNLRELACRILEIEHPDILLVGTSWGPSLDKELVVEGNERGIPTVAVLDMWSYYRERFGWLHEPILQYLPTALAVMDELAYAEAIAAGIPTDRMTITGQPYFDDLERRLCSDEVTQEGRRLKEEWGEGRSVVLFASEAISRDFPHGSPWYRGYTERDALDALLTVVSEMNDAVSLVIRLHPQETPEPFRARFSGSQHPIIIKDVPGPASIAAADVVVGMASMFLLEAALVGKPVVSFQPSLNGPDGFIGNRLGLTKAAYDPAQLKALLLAGLGSPQVQASARNNRWFDGHAAERVEKLVMDLAAKSAGSLTRAHS